MNNKYEEENISMSILRHAKSESGTKENKIYHQYHHPRILFL